MYFAVLACCSEIPADRISVSKNFTASATCSIRLANDRAHQGNPQAPEQLQQRPRRAHDRIGIEATTSSSTRNIGPAGAATGGCSGAVGVDPTLPADGSRALSHSRAIGVSMRRMGSSKAASGKTARAAASARVGCLRQPSTGIGPYDRPFDPAERICRLVLVVHWRSSRIAHRCSSSSGQSPEKCIPIDAALLNSATAATFDPCRSTHGR